MMGNTPEQVAEELTESGADIIGANCGQGIEGFLPICKRMKASTDLPLWMKANAGLPELVNDETIYRTTPEAFARFVPELLKGGAVFIGGCCGTTPEFIQTIRSNLKAMNS
jgi:methionine synthase I (cobalamin-dependent)